MIVRSWQEMNSFFHLVRNLENSCFGPSSWGENTWEKLFKNRELFAKLELREKTLTGYAVFSLVSGEGELLRIGVRKEFRRKGIGRHLLDQSLQELLSNQVNTLFLEVREDNVSAIRFYRHYGFELIGKRKHYYADPPGDALLYSYQQKIKTY